MRLSVFRAVSKRPRYRSLNYCDKHKVILLTEDCQTPI